jgi:hypothetical protein
MASHQTKRKIEATLGDDVVDEFDRSSPIKRARTPISGIVKDIEAPCRRSSQIYYCQMCQGLIKFLIERIPGEARGVRPGIYDLDIPTILSGSNCCLCASLSSKWRELFLPDASQSPNGDVSILRTRSVAIYSGGWFFNFDTMGDLNYPAGLSITSTPKNDFKYSSYDHFVSKSTDSEDSWSLANKWLQHCASGHDCKSATLDAPLPTRLIKLDVFTGMIRLVKSCQLAGPVDYCTLSHCWGDGDFFQLQQSNYEALQEYIPYGLLSRTFKDAIYAAHKSGFEYIWIDSLCIIQRDTEDSAKEARTMEKVYAGSSLNLAATFSKDGRGGLFSSRKPTTIVPCIARSLSISVDDFLIYDKDLWLKEVEDSHLLTRAWVTQELFLAPRTLYFGKSQLLWECHAGYACESQP